MTINERNPMFEKKYLKHEFGGSFKRVKTCANGPKVIFLLIVFGIFVLGAVPRSSALCLFFFSFRTFLTNSAKCTSQSFQLDTTANNYDKWKQCIQLY